MYVLMRRVYKIVCSEYQLSPIPNSWRTAILRRTSTINEAIRRKEKMDMSEILTNASNIGIFILNFICGLENGINIGSVQGRRDGTSKPTGDSARRLTASLLSLQGWADQSLPVRLCPRHLANYWYIDLLKKWPFIRSPNGINTCNLRPPRSVKAKRPREGKGLHLPIRINSKG